MDSKKNKGIDYLLRENIRLARENNRLLRKLWHVEVWGFWTKVLFIAIMVGIPVFVYQYYLSGYVAEVRDTFLELQSDFLKIKDIPENLSLSAVVEAVQERAEDVHQ